MTKRGPALLIVIALVALALPAHADFSSIVRAIDGHGGVKRVWIPFLGVARAIVWVAHPKGVHDFQLATFEGAGTIDPQELHRIMQLQAGPGFKPLVRVWSRRSKEWSFIYAKAMPDSGRMELMILSHDNSDTVLVRVEVDANVVAAELREPKRVSKIAEQ
jgi:hypothetical protein